MLFRYTIPGFTFPAVRKRRECWAGDAVPAPRQQRQDQRCRVPHRLPVKEEGAHQGEAFCGPSACFHGMTIVLRLLPPPSGTTTTRLIRRSMTRRP